MSGLLAALATHHRYADRELATSVSKLVLMLLRHDEATKAAAAAATEATTLGAEERRRELAMQRMRGLRAVPDEDEDADVDGEGGGGDAAQGEGGTFALFGADAAAQLVCGLGGFAPALTSGAGGRAALAAVEGLLRQMMPGFCAQISKVGEGSLGVLVIGGLGVFLLARRLGAMCGKQRFSHKKHVYFVVVAAISDVVFSFFQQMLGLFRRWELGGWAGGGEGGYDRNLRAG